jgi:hypothetical protein
MANKNLGECPTHEDHDGKHDNGKAPNRAGLKLTPANEQGVGGKLIHVAPSHLKKCSGGHQRGLADGNRSARGSDEAALFARHRYTLKIKGLFNHRMCNGTQKDAKGRDLVKKVFHRNRNRDGSEKD